MLGFRPRSSPGCAWPALPDGPPASVLAAYLQLEWTQRLDPSELERCQLAQLRALLTHCYEHVPYYRQCLSAAGLVPDAVRSMADFRRLPLLRRDVCQTRSAELSARALPPGTAAAGQVRTSGTAGQPVQVLQTNVVTMWWVAFHLRDLEWADIDPRGTLAILRPFPRATPEERRQLMEGVTWPSWGSPLDQVIETGPSCAMDLHQEPRRQLEWLRRVAPDYLLSYPSNLDFLASLVRETGERIRGLRAIQAVSETLTEDMQARIEAAFGVPVKNMYSCSEVGYVASPCPAGHGLHVHAENAIVEVLDEQGQPCAPGQRGQLVLTALHNFRMPFIRYQVMDEATPGPARCPCGRGLPLLERIWGRRRPMLHLPNGRVKNSAQLLARIFKLQEIRQCQVVQRAVDQLLVRVVPASGWSADHAGRIERAVEDFFEAPVRLEVQTLERIELPPGGKFSDIVSEIGPAG
jgi:phenylacetate-CoA ligase